MLKIRLTLILVWFSIVASCAASDSFTIKRLNQNELSSLEEPLKNVYFKSFHKVYEEHWSATLERRMLDDFDTLINRFKESDTMLLLAVESEESDDNIVGWVLFCIEEAKQQVIIEILSIDPTYWRKGFGKLLIFSLKEYFPEITSIAVVTRKINTISPKFYEAVGFKRSSFMLPEYNSEEMQGYELMMRKFYQNKLWRDKLIEISKQRGSLFHMRKLTDAEYDEQLRIKLAEETDEVHTAKSRLELIDELGDVFEVIDSLCALHNITREEIIAAQTKKRAERGGFAGRSFVETVEHPDGSFGANYCLAQPEKYPEIL